MKIDGWMDFDSVVSYCGLGHLLFSCLFGPMRLTRVSLSVLRMSVIGLGTLCLGAIVVSSWLSELCCSYVHFRSRTMSVNIAQFCLIFFLA